MPLDVVSGAIAVSVVALVVYTVVFGSKRFLLGRKWVLGQSSKHPGEKDDGPNKGRPWGSKPKLPSD